MKLQIIILIGLIFLSGCNISNIEVTDFETCAAAGNPVMESYPRQCRHGDNLYVEDIEKPVKETFKCELEQRGVQACTLDYTPVCGSVRVECIKAPCPPVKETFSNACSACTNDRVIDYTLGECEE